ncbi:MAG: hypothetical protein AAFP22_09770 [Planctomycetota bacterium]
MTDADALEDPDAPLQFTTLHDARGRFMPGTAGGRRGDGTPVSRPLRSLGAIVRKRYRTEGHANTPERILGWLEDIAQVGEDADRLRAIGLLIRLHDGKQAFAHDLIAEEERAEAGSGTGNSGREFLSTRDVDGLKSQLVQRLAEIFGCEPEHVPAIVAAARERVEADIESEHSDPKPQ